MNKQVIADMMVLKNAIDRVRELHKSWQDLGKQYCEHCKSGKQDTEPVEYPCPTIKALDGEQ